MNNYFGDKKLGVIGFNFETKTPNFIIVKRFKGINLIASQLYILIMVNGVPIKVSLKSRQLVFSRKFMVKYQSS